MRRNTTQYIEDCEACHHRAPKDSQNPRLCASCAGKIRSIDRKAADPRGIRADMKAAGIPVGGRSSE